MRDEALTETLRRSRGDGRECCGNVVAQERYFSERSAEFAANLQVFQRGLHVLIELTTISCKLSPQLGNPLPFDRLRPSRSTYSGLPFVRGIFRRRVNIESHCWLLAAVCELVLYARWDDHRIACLHAGALAANFRRQFACDKQKDLIALS